MSDKIMRGFPPCADSQVTVSNWRKPPFNRWAFNHVREIVPTSEIANDLRHVRDLPRALQNFSDLKISVGREKIDYREFLERTDTSALVILHNGEIIQEYYAPDTLASTQHILMSVSKSVLGLLVGILAERGILALEAAVTDWIPEISGSAYSGATLRDLLDMRVGVLFNEDYLASEGAIIDYRKAQGWDPLMPGEKTSDLRSYFSSLVQPDGVHADRFHYVSPNTDLLGWVIERATGRRFAEIVSEYLWQPMGAERSAYITVDRLGAPRCAGGICATTRDLARLGLLIAENGAYAGRQIIPVAWLQDIMTAGDDNAWRDGDFQKYFPGMPMHYRSKWYALRGDAPMIFGFGVFGQYLFVDPRNRIVIAKFSSQAIALDEQRLLLTMRAVEALRNHLR